jgi:hypothetical protein
MKESWEGILSDGAILGRASVEGGSYCEERGVEGISSFVVCVS